MSERKAILINVPVGRSDSVPHDGLGRVSREVRETSERIQTRMNEVRQRRKELVESITDRSMQASLKAKK